MRRTQGRCCFAHLPWRAVPGKNARNDMLSLFDLPILGVEIDKERVEAVRGGDGGDENLWVEAWFIHSAESLAQKGDMINLQKKFFARGYLFWEL